MTAVARNKQEAVALGLTRYFTGKPCVHGHVSDRQVGGECLACKREFERNDPKRKERKKRYKERPETTAKRKAKANAPETRARTRGWLQTPAGCTSMALARARVRAKERGREFALDDYAAEITRVIAEGCCELTGLPFDLAGKDKRFRPSLDRIDSSKGYTPDNVRVVLTCVNKMLQDYGEAFLLKIAQAIIDKAALS